MKKFILLSAVLAVSAIISTTTPIQSYAQSAITNANDCVSLQYLKNQRVSTRRYVAQFQFTNKCNVDIFLSYRHTENDGRCGSTGAIVLTAGHTATRGGEMLNGVKHHISWCADFFEGNLQRDSGYKTCSQSGQPSSCR